jgi:hypothetical protein
MLCNDVVTTSEVIINLEVSDNIITEVTEKGIWK